MTKWIAIAVIILALIGAFSSFPMTFNALKDTKDNYSDNSKLDELIEQERLCDDSAYACEKDSDCAAASYGCRGQEQAINKNYAGDECLTSIITTCEYIGEQIPYTPKCIRGYCEKIKQ